MPKRKTYVTPVGVAIYPHLNAPDFKYKKDHGEYHIKLSLPADDPWVENFQNEMEALRDQTFQEELKALKEKNPKAKEATLKKQLEFGPIGITEEVDEETLEPTGNVILKFAMAGAYKNKQGRVVNLKPALFDGKKNEMDRRVPIYGGSQVRVKFWTQPYNLPAVGIGVTLKLEAVQVIELVSGGSGASADGFDEEEDGYEFSESDIQETADDDTPESGDDDDDEGDVGSADDF